MSQDRFPRQIQPLCQLFGVSRQAYYKHSFQEDELDVLITSIVFYCRYIRHPDNLPMAGCRELYELCQRHFGNRFTIGRDRFYDILRANGLMLRRRRYHPRTTDSKHPFFLYDDLLNTTPTKYEASRPGDLVVCDITYIPCQTQGNFAYLSLVTDAYSRAVVGHCLHPTLERQGPLNAIKQAIKTLKEHGIETDQMIHHSDRGIQYASKEYINYLKENNLRISMTQTGDPLHNALAERMNNTIKNSWIYDYGNMEIEEARKALDRAIEMYNTARPHQSLGMKTPMEVLTGMCQNPLLEPKNLATYVSL